MTSLPTIVIVLVFARFSMFGATSSNPDLIIESPLDFQVVQRATAVGGNLWTSGKATVPSANSLNTYRLEARVTGQSPFGKLPDGWQPLSYHAQVGSFRWQLRVPAGGWYRVEVRLIRDGEVVVSHAVEHVGVGEVFVIAGQSNAANYGEEPQSPQTGMVAAFDGSRWQSAGDPQPGASGTKGSFVPRLGDELAAHFHVPVGFVGAAVGSTSVREWLPAHTVLARLPSLTRHVLTNRASQWESSGRIFDNFTAKMNQLGTNGFRAVLWHQGESDAHQADPERTLPGEIYRQYLEQLIHDSRQAIGWDAPWFVAQASYHSPADPASEDIRAAQKAVWAEGVALQGPDTDTLVGEMREQHGTGVHLSAAGLRAHAHLWFVKVRPWLDRGV